MGNTRARDRTGICVALMIITPDPLQGCLAPGFFFLSQSPAKLVSFASEMRSTPQTLRIRVFLSSRNLSARAPTPTKERLIPAAVKLRCNIVPTTTQIYRNFTPENSRWLGDSRIRGRYRRRGSSSVSSIAPIPQGALI